MNARIYAAPVLLTAITVAAAAPGRKVPASQPLRMNVTLHWEKAETSKADEGNSVRSKRTVLDASSGQWVQAEKDPNGHPEYIRVPGKVNDFAGAIAVSGEARDVADASYTDPATGKVVEQSAVHTTSETYRGSLSHFDVGPPSWFHFGNGLELAAQARATLKGRSHSEIREWDDEHKPVNRVSDKPEDSLFGTDGGITQNPEPGRTPETAYLMPFAFSCRVMPRLGPRPVGDDPRTRAEQGAWDLFQSTAKSAEGVASPNWFGATTVGYQIHLDDHREFKSEDGDTTWVEKLLVTAALGSGSAPRR